MVATVTHSHSGSDASGMIPLLKADAKTRMIDDVSFVFFATSLGLQRLANRIGTSLVGLAVALHDVERVVPKPIGKGS